MQHPAYPLASTTYHWISYITSDIRIYVYPLYILTLSLDIYKEKNRKKSWLLATSYALIYLCNVNFIIGFSI